MPSCSICLEPFTAPVSLPCGHVFCRDCVRRTVESETKARNMQHFCPTCRAPYGILNVDPALIPAYLRPHILPPIRRVFLDEPAEPIASTSTSGSTSSPSLSAELARATAEIEALKMHCAAWRRRAETHAAGNTALLAFTRSAKDCAVRLRAERDAERNRCVLLKRKLAEIMPEHDLDASACNKRKHEEEKVVMPCALPRVGLPAFLVQCEGTRTTQLDSQQSLWGPPMKRRKESRRRESEDDDVAAPIRDSCGAVDAAAAALISSSGPPAPAASTSDSAASSTSIPPIPRAR